MKISIVVPVLNELQQLPGMLADLRQREWIDEIVVVDGGSTDGTRRFLKSQTAARVVESTGGKGAQLNAGASAAAGDLLLFLHADCRLPDDAGRRMRRALAHSTAAGGCFHVRFAEGRPWTLAWVARGINIRTCLTRSATGDQAIFVRREIFERIGGCPPWPLFEDVELVRRIRRAGRFEVIASPVTISARRYLRRGVLRTTLRIWALRFGYRVGISPFRLKSWFDDVRAGPGAL